MLAHLDNPAPPPAPPPWVSESATSQGNDCTRKIKIKKIEKIKIISGAKKHAAVKFSTWFLKFQIFWVQCVPLSFSVSYWSSMNRKCKFWRKKCELQTTNQRNVIGSCTFLLNSNLNLKQILNFAPARAIFFTRCPKKSSWQNSGACLRAFFGTSYTKTSFLPVLGIKV